MELTGCSVVTDTTAVLRDDNAVVAHTTWLARTLQRCTESGRHLTLLTPPTSELTLGLVQVLERTGSHWVVQDGEDFYSGLTGEAVVWTGEAFAPTMELREAFLQSPPLTHRGLLCSAEVVHPARSATRVGVLADALCRFGTGSAPSGWGVVEPCSQPWDLDALTNHVKQAMPLTVWVHSMGGGPGAWFTGFTSVERRTEGVVERLVCQFDLGPLDGADEPTAGQAAPRPRNWDGRDLLAFQELAADLQVRFAALVGIEGGYGLFRAPRVQRLARPLSSLFGPELARLRGADALLERVGPAGRRLTQGGWDSIGVLHDESNATAHPLLQFAQLVDWLDQ